MPQVTKRKFAPGDRVSERPSVRTFFAGSPQAKERAKSCSGLRKGVVVDVYLKGTKSAKSRRQAVVLVQWDHLKTPVEHAQARLCHEDELSKYTQTFATMLD